MATETVDRVTDANSATRVSTGSRNGVTAPSSAVNCATATRNAESGSLEELAGEIRTLTGTTGGPPSEGVRQAWRLRAQAQREGGLCGKCGRVLDPAEVVYRVRLAGWHGGSLTPSCRGCFDAERERRSRFTWWIRPFDEALRPPRPCAGCGRLVVNQGAGDHRKHTFCSVRCAWTARNERLKDDRLEGRQGKTCPVCGEVFDGTRRDAVTCSPACRQKAYRQRRRLEEGR
jgi:hypothetical protein